MRRYVAFVHRGKGGACGVSFPDFPGCTAVEGSLDRALDGAAHALRLYVEDMVADGERVPPPRAIDDIRADPEYAAELADAVVTLVPLLPPRGRPRRINVMIDSNLLAAIDRKARRLELSRSAFLARSAGLLIDAPESGIARRGAGLRRAAQRKKGDGA